ncbi:MAG TPA: glycosyltransferase family 2 protein [Bryobacteraceae bacterium]|nr:glycosyltransferase family 2 protein [Bryobacteraceae bacterium]
MSRQYLTPVHVSGLLRRSCKYVFGDLPTIRVEREARPAPLVSVIIATYNWSNVLRFAIQSVLWQTEQNFELLVIGDACTDDTESMVRGFNDGRIRWKNLATNSGSQCAPNNAGLAMARGKYIAYLGHDDIWHPQHLGRMIASLESRNADVASALVEMIGPKGTNFRVVTGIYPAEGFNANDCLPPSGLLHRADVAARAGAWPDYRTVHRNPDMEFVYRAWAAGCRFVSTRELTVYKFNSALRKNSYIEKPCHEQTAYSGRLLRTRWFQLLEALQIARVHVFRLPMIEPGFTPPPDASTTGWYVTQYRKYRGLE